MTPRVIADQSSFAARRTPRHGSSERLGKCGKEIHTPDSQSVTVSQAAKLWLDRCRADDLEPTTIAAYDQQVRLHIEPLCGGVKLSQLTKPLVEAMRDKLIVTKSRAMASRVMRAMSAVVGDAQRRGLVAQNVCAGVRVRRSNREAKVVIPTKGELRLIARTLDQLPDTASASLMALAMFSGLRASELRGLPWRNVDLRRGTVTVSQRADRLNVIGPPKSESGNRTVPIPALAIGILRRWKVACPTTSLNLVFPSVSGGVMSHRYMTLNMLDVAQVAAGVTADGESDVVRGRYTLHDFRHAAASLWIEQQVSPKRVQRWMGHSSIQVTFDTYGHLFSNAERDAAVAAAVEGDLLTDCSMDAA